MDSQYNQIPYPRWAIHILENNYTTEVLCRSDKYESYIRLSRLRVQHLVRGVPRAPCFEGQQGFTTGVLHDWEKQILLLKGAHKITCALGQRAKVVI